MGELPFMFMTSPIGTPFRPVSSEIALELENSRLDAALTFRNMSIKDALDSENYIIKILAILDKRIGKRTLDQIKTANEYLQYPPWVQQFYHLRLS